MPDLDNVGDTNRWEDPRDTVGGPDEAEEDQGWHNCHFCGEVISKKGYENNGRRHFLSDCRPDLVEHEPGELCTWWYRKDEIPIESTCYAYESWGDKDNGYQRHWTTEHTHFFKDGPM
jgi:hypothetical protein